MPDRIPQSVVMRVPLKAYLSTDHIANATGKTIAVQISKNGAAFGNPSAGAVNATEIGNGWYYADLSTTDVGALGPLIVRGTSTGVDDVEIVYQVVDANSLGAGFLDASVNSRSTYAGADTSGTTTLLGRIPGTIQPQTGDSYSRIGAAGAGLTALGDTRVANLDTTVSSRLAPSGTLATVTTLTNKTGFSMAATGLDAIPQSAVGMIEIAKAIWDRTLTGSTHNINNSAGKDLRLAAGTITASTAQDGGAASIQLAATESSVDGIYDTEAITIIGGTGAGQARMIIQYSGITKIAYVDREWRIVPDATSQYEIRSYINMISTDEGLAQGAGSSTITLSASASSVDNAYNGQTIVLRTGVGSDQSRIIVAYNGTTKVATVAQPWVENPVNGTGYIIWPLGRAQTVALLPSMDLTAPMKASVTIAATAATPTVTAATVTDKTGYSLAVPPLTVVQTADAIWDASIAGHGDAGSMGAALLAGGGGGGGGIVDPIAIAETILTLDWGTVSGEADRSVLNALRALRNKMDIADNGDGTGTITVTKEDDVAPAWTAQCVFDNNGRSISGVDPA